METPLIIPPIEKSETPLLSMRNNRLLLILVVMTVLTIIGIGSFFLLLSKKRMVSPTETIILPTASPISQFIPVTKVPITTSQEGVKSYSQQPLSFSYPSDWVVTEIKPEGSVLTVGPKKDLNTSIRIEYNPDATVQQTIGSNPAFSQRTSLVNGETFTVYTGNVQVPNAFANGSPTKRAIYAFVQKGQLHAVLSIILPDANQNPAIEKQFTSLLSSFHLR